MKTDDKLAALRNFVLSDRMRGFFYGYQGQPGPGSEFLGNPEYIKGWEEGAALLLDERRAFAARLDKHRGF
ncbi:MAG TPA: hypothetical protein VKE42_00105 [Candidatus Cybelea sp.]|nr:hypothetical protein [Candidatus Cybelea sp.]